MDWILKLINIEKDFIFHHNNGIRLQVLKNFSMNFYPGETIVLKGPSGVGKSTVLKMIYAGYKTQKGKILVRHKNKPVDIAKAAPGVIYDIRKYTIGYVSQFLRVVPRVSALDTVIEPLTARGMSEEKARAKGALMLERLYIPENLWHLSATTFSGGEQQRINIARSFIAPFPVMLLDEPTASLDKKNRRVVMELLEEAQSDGTCIISIFHDESDQKLLAGRTIELAGKNVLEEQTR